MAIRFRDNDRTRRRPRRSRRRAERWDRSPRRSRKLSYSPSALADPRRAIGLSAGEMQRFRRRRTLSAGRRSPLRRLSAVDRLIVFAVLVVGVFLLVGLWRITRVDASITGVRDGATLTAEKGRALVVDVKVAQPDRITAASLTFDGKPVSDARSGTGFHWASGGAIADGRHQLVLSVPRPVLGPSTFRWTFVVDTTPPTLQAPAQVVSKTMKDRVQIKGRVEVGSTLKANGKAVKVGRDGTFTLSYDRPPAGSVQLRAEDAAGHVVSQDVFTPVTRPVVRGVHVTALGWASADLRNSVLELVKEGRINTVELDLKDEDGQVGYASKVALAKRIGSAKGYYDLPAAVAQLHALGVRVVGRVVAFRDPILASWAWSNGERSWVLQRPDGSWVEAYGGFTNFADPQVEAYNTDIGLEAADAGVDEVLWDYVRRPEGDLKQLVFPGLKGTPEDGLVGFLAQAHQKLRDRGVFQGASVFGVAAGDPTAVGQDVTRIARHVDYLAPMVYPSLWVAGEYRVSSPAKHPYDIVQRSLQDFQAKSAGTSVGFTPWLQDFSLDGVTYGAAEVRAQIDAAASLGINSFFLWNPRVHYDGDGLDPAGG